MVSKSKFQYSDPRSFPARENMDLLFNSDIVNLLLKGNGGSGRRPHFVIFVVWSALIVGGWVVVAWSRNSSYKTIVLIFDLIKTAFLSSYKITNF